MKTLFVGDLHGNLEVFEAARDCRAVDRVVFMGDYLDSFNRSVTDQIRVLEGVLFAVLADPKRYIGLFGNHELSYITAGMRCRGFNIATNLHVHHLKSRMEQLLKPYVEIDQFLVSHAGVSASLLRQLGLSAEQYLERGDFRQVGTARDGNFLSGGLYWCDWTHEFEPVSGLNQIVGHSFYKHEGVIRTMLGKDSTNYCVDCINQLDTNYEESIFLVLDDGVPMVVNFDFLLGRETLMAGAN